MTFGDADLTETPIAPIMSKQEGGNPRDIRTIGQSLQIEHRTDMILVPPGIPSGQPIPSGFPVPSVCR